MSPDSMSMESIPSASRQTENREGPKKSLLSWVSKAIPSNLGIEVKDFGPSWRDGYAFMGLINAIDGNLIDIENYRNASNKSRLHTSFNVAETELGIPRLLDPDDVDLPKPDERSVMTYVAQFLHKYPEPKVNPHQISKKFFIDCFFDRRSHLTASNKFRRSFNGCANKSSNTTA
jgi:nesprin-1